ncbi:MAG TPA: metal ABC transporter permease [Thermoanaerobaculia bacterium]|nr:metal ABC transporter permease [Thermoanaerobaculia bacterium]
MDVLLFLAVPFVAGLILTGIHAYLGLHVVERGVIFVDLSLAQIAALGTTMAYLAGHDLHDPVTYFWSLGFTIAGAGIFALTRGPHHAATRIPQEAIIGVVYAVSAAASILAMSKAPEGTEHLKDMLVGNILTVSWGTVLKTAVVYAIVGAFHWVFRKRFLAISMGENIPHIRWWDFLFYTSFGFVVTSSVVIAGVLLVFSYLIVPSVAAMMFARTVGSRLAFAWVTGGVVSAAGVLLSFYYDLPTGATIVCTFGAALALLSVVRLARRSR